MKVGLTYLTAADLPSDADLFGKLLPGATAQARRWRLADPDGAAADAVTNVVLESRYQERWDPSGTGKLEHYLYTMVLNRLRDAMRSQIKRTSNELTAFPDTGMTGAEHGADPAAEDAFTAVELRASLEHFREVAADADRLAATEVGGRRVYPQGVSLTELLDATAAAVLAGENASTRSLAKRLGVAHHAGIVTAQRRLATALESADA